MANKFACTGGPNSESECTGGPAPCREELERAHPIKDLLIAELIFVLTLHLCYAPLLAGITETGVGKVAFSFIVVGLLSGAVVIYSVYLKKYPGVWHKRNDDAVFGAEEHSFRPCSHKPSDPGPVYSFRNIEVRSCRKCGKSIQLAHPIRYSVFRWLFLFLGMVSFSPAIRCCANGDPMFWLFDGVQVFSLTVSIFLTEIAAWKR